MQARRDYVGAGPGRRRLMLFLAITLLIMLLVLIGGGWFYRAHEQTIRQEIEKQLVSVVRLKVDTIKAWREIRISDAVMLANMLLVTRDAASALADSKADAFAGLRELLSLFQQNQDCADIMLVDADGKLRLSLTADAELHLPDRAALADALRDRKPVFVDLHAGKADAAPHIAIVAPLFDGGGHGKTPLGALIVIHDARKSLYPLIRAWPAQSRTAETLLVRRDGDHVLYLNDLRHKAGTALKLRIPLTKLEVPAVMAVLGRKGVVQGRDYRGTDVLSVLQPIPDSPWFMEAKVDADEVLAVWREQSRLILALLLSLVAMAGALGFMLWQRHAKSHYRVLCQSADALQESEARFDQLATQGGVIIWEVDANGLYTHVSHVSEAVLGYRPEELVGRLHFYDLHPESGRESFKKAAFAAFERKQSLLDLVNSMQTRDGRIVWVSTNALPILNADGSLRGYRGSDSDITARKKAEDEKAALEEQNRKLQKAESLGRMAGSIAHHFNNQLMGVMGNLELVMEDMPRGQEPFLTLSIAMQSARQAAEVSRSMLTYIGQTTGRHARLDLARICRQALPILSAGMPDGINLESVLPDPGPVIYSDENQIQQLLTNLLINACEASETGGGTIRLTVATVTPSDIPAAHRFPSGWQPQAQTYACLNIADTGSGIAAGDIERIFDPFFSTKFTGRGMGLPVVLGVVRAHDGVVTVESQSGRGCAFKVFLPLLEEAGAKPAQPPAPDRQLSAGGTVLLIDDEEQVRQVAEKMIKRSGFTVLSAESGPQGVELLRRHMQEIVCAICDLTMPVMDGWGTLAALRAIRPELPVILASGYDEAVVMAGDHPERPQAFLGKPYQMQSLLDAINKARTA